jgi:hypothetical protein
MILKFEKRWLFLNFDDTHDYIKSLSTCSSFVKLYDIVILIFVSRKVTGRARSKREVNYSCFSLWNQSWLSAVKFVVNWMGFDNLIIFEIMLFWMGFYIFRVRLSWKSGFWGRKKVGEISHSYYSTQWKERKRKLSDTFVSKQEEGFLNNFETIKLWNRRNEMAITFQWICQYTNKQQVENTFHKIFSNFLFQIFQTISKTLISKRIKHWKFHNKYFEFVR